MVKLIVYRVETYEIISLAASIEGLSYLLYNKLDIYGELNIQQGTNLSFGYFDGSYFSCIVYGSGRLNMNGAKIKGNSSLSNSIRFYENSTCNIQNSELENTPIYFYNDTKGQINNSNILIPSKKNSITNSGSNLINAKNNYWNHQTGPYHAGLNPNGVGCAVGDNIEFIPWENTPAEFLLMILSQPKSQQAIVGETAIFAVSAWGTNLIYQWQKDGTDLIENDRITGTKANKLVIHEVIQSDEGNYTCIVSNNTGNIISNAASLIIADNKITIPDNWILCEAENTKPRIFELFDKTYKISYYLTLGENISRSGYFHIPIIMQIPDPEIPEIEEPVFNKIELGQVLNYVYLNDPFISDKLSMEADDQYWQDQALEMEILQQIYDPDRVKWVKSCFFSSKVLFAIGRTMAIGDFSNLAHTILSAGSLLFSLGVSSMNYVKSLTQTLDNNFAATALSALSDLDPKQYQTLSEQINFLEYVESGFPDIQGYNNPAYWAQTVYWGIKEYEIIKSFITSYQLSQMPFLVHTQMGDMFVRTSHEYMNISRLHSLEALKFVAKSFSFAVAEEIIYRNYKKVEEAFADIVFMGNFHSAVLEYYAKVLKSEYTQLSNVDNFNSLFEYDEAITLYRVKVQRYFEVLNALMYNNYWMTYNLRDIGLGLYGHIAVSKNTLLEFKNAQEFTESLYHDIVKSTLWQSDYSQYIMENYPNFKTSKNNKKSTKGDVENLIKLNSLNLNTSGNLTPNDTLIVSFNVLNLSTVSLDTLNINIYCDDQSIDNIKLVEVQVGEINSVSISWIAKQGDHRFNIIPEIDGVVDTLSFSVYTFEDPQLINPISQINVPESCSYDFAITYQSSNGTGPDNNNVYLVLDNKTISLSANEIQHEIGTEYYVNAVPLDPGYHRYCFVTKVNNDWIRIPGIGEYIITIGNDFENRLSLKYPTLTDSLNISTDSLTFIWQCNNVVFADYHFDLYIADNPLFYNALKFKNLSDTTITITNSFKENSIYYWKANIISILNDTIVSNQVQQFVLENQPSLNFKSVYNICDGDSMIFEIPDIFKIIHLNNQEIKRPLILKNEGTYKINVIDKFGHEVISKFDLINNENPDLNIPDTIFTLTGESISIDAGPGNLFYIWNNGSEEQILVINDLKEGKYEFFVTVRNQYGCTNVDSVVVLVSPTTHVIEQKVNQIIKVFPNPFNYNTTIEFPNPEFKEFTLVITDLGGAIVRRFDNIRSSTLTLEKQNLKPGYYFVDLIGTNKRFRSKIIID